MFSAQSTYYLTLSYLPQTAASRCQQTTRSLLNLEHHCQTAWSHGHGALRRPPTLVCSPSLAHLSRSPLRYPSLSRPSRSPSLTHPLRHLPQAPPLRPRMRGGHGQAEGHPCVFTRLDSPSIPLLHHAFCFAALYLWRVMIDRL
jgi:hypothetical protein